MLSSEVLPAPLGPIIDRMLPRGNSTDTSSMASTPPNLLRTPSIDICAVAGAAIRLAVSAMLTWPSPNERRRPRRMHDRLGGPAKELAQIGAAIGREFTHPLLAAVVRKPEAELRMTLGRLI